MHYIIIIKIPVATVTVMVRSEIEYVAAMFGSFGGLKKHPVDVSFTSLHLQTGYEFG